MSYLSMTLRRAVKPMQVQDYGLGSDLINMPQQPSRLSNSQ